MKTTYPIIYLILLVAFTSCEQFLEVELPGQEPRMVLNALLEPSDTLRVYLTKSKGVLEARDFYEEFELVEGAKVYLKHQDGQMFPMDYINRSRPYETNAFYYLSGHELADGQTYEIIAEKEGLPSISSTQKMPTKTLIKSIEMIDLGPRENSDSENEFEVRVKFDDPPGENFYEISGGMFARGFHIYNGDTSLYFFSSDLYPPPCQSRLQK